MTNFSPEELKQVEQTIEEVEKSTAGEIVVAAVESSGPYRWISWFWMFIGWFFASTLVWAVSYRAVWPQPASQAIEWQLVGMFVGFFLSKWHPLRRLTIPKKLAMTRVHRECLASFIGMGVTETRDRTGILIYISDLEKIVEILTDRGIHQKCGANYWDKEVQLIVQGLKTGRGCEFLCMAIRQIGEQLAVHFPPRPDNVNELSNAPRR